MPNILNSLADTQWDNLHLKYGFSKQNILTSAYVSQITLDSGIILKSGWFEPKWEASGPPT